MFVPWIGRFLVLGELWRRCQDCRCDCDCQRQCYYSAVANAIANASANIITALSPAPSPSPSPSPLLDGGVELRLAGRNGTYIYVRMGMNV